MFEHVPQGQRIIESLSIKISAPAKGDCVPINFTASGTYSGGTVTCQYFTDPSMTTPDQIGVVTQNASRGVWTAQFTGCTKSTKGMIKAFMGTGVPFASVSPVNVADPAPIAITSPIPDANGALIATFPVIGTFDNTLGVSAVPSLLYPAGSATTELDPLAATDSGSKVWAGVVFGAQGGDHNVLVAMLLDSSNRVIATTRVGELNIP